MGVLGGEGVAGNTIRVRGILYGLCVRVWVWVLVRVCNGDELGDARGRGGEDMIGSRGGGARLDPDPDFNFDFDTNTPRSGLRIVRGGSTGSEDIVEQLHRLRSWWVSDLGVGGKENGEMGLLSSDELEDEKEEWDWLLEKESRDDRGVSESVLARGRYTSFMDVSGITGEIGWIFWAGTKEGWE